MKLTELNHSLERLYQPSGFKDYIPSGLLIEGSDELSRGATAVSFNLETIKKAVDLEAQFLVVHHGHGFWDNQSKLIKGGLKKKIELMLKHGISLFAYHLPMDAHLELGNNAGLLKALGLYRSSEFLPHGKHFIGLTGEFEVALTQDDFLEKVESSIGAVNFSFLNGTSKIKTVALCSGGAASSIEAAKATGADVFLTGEAKEDTSSFCMDEQFNFVAAGHYRTEVFGPQALAEYLTNKEKIPTDFIHAPSAV